MNVVGIKRAPSDLAAALRRLANLADAGELTDYVGAYVVNGERYFTYAASAGECLLSATLLQQNCIDRMRA
jgi:hypothetical protein